MSPAGRPEGRSAALYVLPEVKRAVIIALWTMLGLLALITVYVGSYFVVMEEGDTFNPRTYEREYRSYCRFASVERVPGPLSIYVTTTHWTNALYYPMDRLMDRPHHSVDQRSEP